MGEEVQWYEKILDLQLRENAQVWRSFEEQGLTNASLRLGFIYMAPGETEARHLSRFLREQTDYEVKVSSQVNPHDNVTDWLVIGATQPTEVSLDLLNDWVEWMVAAGAVEGPCAFDGWAAQVADQR